MYTKSPTNYLAFRTLVTVIGFFLCAESKAADFIAAVGNPLDAEITTMSLDAADINIDTKSEIATDTLSDNALVAIEAIDSETKDSSTVIVNTPSAQINSSQKTFSSPLKNPYSQLVNLALNGKGVNGVRNYAEAADQYCREARDHNDANAQFALGWMYVNGRGVEKNEDIAALFFSKAASQGHTSAKNWLASSQGNASLATPPQCMSPAQPTITTNNSQGKTQSATNALSFYSKGPIYKLVAKIAPKFKIETDLAMAFIAVESGFNPKATSPRNAQGLMQLIPETAARFNVKNAYDPEQNINGGLAYLQWLLTYFEGDVELVAAAYNSGENAVERYKGVPPYPETRKYVRKIASLYKKSYHPYRASSDLSKKSSFTKISG